VAYPSTPASYFHLLRWQGRDHQEKPMVVLTPKSLLRHPRCVSPLTELAQGRFVPVLDDPSANPASVTRVVLVTGKLYYDLLAAREKAGDAGAALVRLEQLYPFPSAELAVVLMRYPQADLVWVQEEPRNMGAWRFIRERFLDGEVPDPERRLPRYVGRTHQAAPAPGSHKTHVAEQDALVNEALFG
jgi:2-oxoglutarate dehydrogenase E1 component